MTAAIQFDDESQLSVIASQLSLGHIAFFSRYARQDHIAPLMNKESWDFFRRAPTLWAFNPNKPSATAFNHIKNKSNKIVITKNNQHVYEEACVVFKDISFDPKIDCSHHNSVSYFLRKATVKQGLDVIGVRMAYLDDVQKEEYYHLFHADFEAGDNMD